MKKTLIGLLALAVAAPLLLARGEPSSATHTIDSLAFIGGHWVGKGLGGDIEEGWFPPKHGCMVGVFRLSSAEKGLIVMEPVIIEQKDDAVVFRFRHFGPGMKAWEENDKPLTFHLVEVQGSRAVFDAPDRAQKPGRLVYAVENDRLRVDVSSVTPDGATDETFTVEFERFRR